MIGRATLLLLGMSLVAGQTATDKPSIYSLHITSNIEYRFATTKVVSKLANSAKDAKEAIFSLQLPKTAFISNFSMIMDDGKEYVGVVKEKEQAKKDYDAAKKKGQSAGKVSAVKPRNTQRFQVAINVGAGEKIEFILQYQEQLLRRLGSYEHKIYIDPGQLVRDFKVDVYINETRPITSLSIPPLASNEVFDWTQANPLARKTFNPGDTSAYVAYHPSYEQQRAKDPTGMNGQLVVRYDVGRDKSVGEVLVVDGYFVHFFSPKDLPQGTKNILFVLDVSGSMSGTKLKQVKESMVKILGDLVHGDLFNIMLFSSNPKFWKTDMQPVNEDTKRQAMQYIGEMMADGGTNINGALIGGIEFLVKDRNRLKERGSLASIVVFLTDGDPTVGVTNKDDIRNNVRSKNEGQFALYSLGFGDNLDFKFLQKLSAQNGAFARRIYEDSDAALQLNNFYNEISSPLLADIAINYDGSEVVSNSLTDTRFKSLFDGGECVIAGELSPSAAVAANIDFNVAASARSAKGPVVYQKAIPVVSGSSAGGHVSSVRRFTERLWAYLTISELFDKMLATTNKTEEAALKAKALQMSLKYNFVTPLTSMVVIKPDDPSTDASNVEESQRDMSGQQKQHGAAIPASIPRRTPAKSPARMRPQSSRPTSFADNDPHFMINVNGADRPVCFDVNGEKDEIYQLIHDKDFGLSINAKIIESGRVSKKGKKLTYFGKMAIVTEKLTLIVTPHSFKVDTTSYNWKRGQELRRDKVKMVWPDKGKVVIEIREGITVTLARHVQKGQRVDKAHYLGLYITDGTGFSKNVHGLIGQFQHRNINVDEDPVDNRTARLTFVEPNRPHRDIVEVHHGNRRNLLNKQHVDCWHVRNQGRGVLDGAASDYILSKVTSRKLAKKLAKKLQQTSTNSRKVRL